MSRRTTSAGVALAALTLFAVINLFPLESTIRTDAQVRTDFAATGAPSAIGNVIINEVDSDTPGTDIAEFIELYDGGVGNTPLDGYVVVFFNGGAVNDASYA